MSTATIIGTKPWLPWPLPRCEDFFGPDGLGSAAIFAKRTAAGPWSPASWMEAPHLPARAVASLSWLVGLASRLSALATWSLR